MIQESKLSDLNTSFGSSKQVPNLKKKIGLDMSQQICLRYIQIRTVKQNRSSIKKTANSLFLAHFTEEKSKFLKVVKNWFGRTLRFIFGRGHLWTLTNPKSTQKLMVQWSNGPFMARFFTDLNLFVYI